MQAQLPTAMPRRGRGPLFWILAVLLSCVLLSCVGVGGFAAFAASRPTPTPQIARLGGTVTTKNWQLTASNVETAKEIQWSSLGNKQAAVGQWLMITATLTNTGKENFGVNTWDFEVVDGSGATYKHSTDLAALSYPDTKGAKSASSQQVPPGVSTPLILVFDINPAATGLKLVFKQDNNPRIDLGR